jgi:hypothetical protein
MFPAPPRKPPKTRQNEEEEQDERQVRITPPSLPIPEDKRPSGRGETAHSGWQCRGKERVIETTEEKTHIMSFLLGFPNSFCR